MRRKTLMRILYVHVTHCKTRAACICVPTRCVSVGGITERGGERRRKKSNKIMIIKKQMHKLNEPNTTGPTYLYNIIADGDPRGD